MGRGFATIDDGGHFDREAVVDAQIGRHA
jgi:hypothetical protein